MYLHNSIIHINEVIIPTIVNQPVNIKSYIFLSLTFFIRKVDSIHIIIFTTYITIVYKC